jgi:hypothetical protein
MMDAKAAQLFPLISIVLQGNSKSVDISLLEKGDVLMEANQVCLKLGPYCLLLCTDDKSLFL